ncbi:MAG: recombinase family protein, partial [Acidobacteria bacterium]|nr:recombinase family protein [Acidobacteriota bacterium]
MTDRAALYLRVSTDEQRNSNLSIANQLQQCRAYAERKGYTLYDCGRYVDELGQDAPQGTPAYAEDASARNVTTPALLGLLKAAKAGSFDVMIAMDVTRVSRGDPALFGSFQTTLKGYGVRLEFPSTTGDKRTDVVMGQMHALASFFENDDRARRTRQGKRQSAEVRKRHTGPAPFGYLTTEEKQLALNPETQAIARGIFEAYLNGSSLRQVARDLNAAGVRSPRGAGEWASQSLGKILRNPVYRGTYIFGARARVDGKI